MMVEAHEAATWRAKKEQKWFTTLPVEVSLKIFEFLTQWERCNCMLVCRGWHKLCNDSSLWRELDLQVESPRVTGALLARLASRWPAVRSLRFHGHRGDHLEGVLPRLDADTWRMFPQLERVAFSNCHPSLVSPEVLRTLFTSTNGRLKSLRCEFIPLLEMQHLAAIFQPNLRYTELSLGGCVHIDDSAVLFTLSPSSSGECLKHLRVLDLDGLLHLSDSGVLKVLENCPGLTSLALDGGQLTDKVPEFIGSGLQGLEWLSIRYCESLTDESLYHLSSLRCLKGISLTKGESLTNEGFETFFEALAVSSTKDGDSSKPKGLRKISFANCYGLHDSALIKLTTSFPFVKELDLSWCWELTDTGLETLVKNCPELSSLVLVGVKECHCASIVSVTGLPKLLTLDLTQVNNVDDAQLVVMKKARPWVTITNYYGDEIIAD